MLAPSGADSSSIPHNQGVINELQTRLQFPTQPVLLLKEKDFALETEDKIVLKGIVDCTMVLFHGNDSQSQGAMRVWLNVAEMTAGPIFAAINVVEERNVAQGMAHIAGQKNHPLHPFGLRGFPVIIIYQKRYPVGIYNGIIGTSAIIQWSLTYACQGDYSERRNVYAGQMVDTDNRIAIEGRKALDDNVTKTSLEAAQTTTPYSEKDSSTANSPPKGAPAPSAPSALESPIATPNRETSIA